MTEKMRTDKEIWESANNSWGDQYDETTAADVVVFKEEDAE